MATAAHSKFLRLLVPGVVSLLLVSCGGSSDPDDGDTTYTIGGSITGLAGTVGLRNNGGDSLSRNTNGGFTFATPLNSGASYSVTVSSQPAGQTCAVANASGTATARVTNVAVNCTNNTYTLGGTVSGLNGSLVLREENEELSLLVTASGAYQFAGRLAQGDVYVVSVYKQPLGQACTVTSGATGTSTANVSNIVVNCVDQPNTVSGTVSGLTSGTALLQLNLADNITVGNGAFAFPKKLANGAPYVVSLAGVAGHACSGTALAGTANANVTNVAFTCTPLAANLPVGGNVQGLTGTVVLRNSVNNETVPVTANGNFTFPTPVPTGTEYAVVVQTQPAGQVCSVGGVNFIVSPLAGGSTTVRCAAGTETHTVGGTVNGLKSTLRLAVNLNNLALDVAPSGAGPVSFTFPVPFQYDTEFLVSVRQQPTGQTCLIPHAGSHVPHADVTDIVVTCVDNVTDVLSGTYGAVGGDFAVTFYGNGAYVFASVDDDPACGASQGSGVEMGAYRYNAAAGTLALVSNVLDTNGSAPGCGVWQGGASVIHGPVAKSGVAQDTVLVLTPTDGSVPIPLVPVASVPNRPTGSFAGVGGLSFLVFLENGRYLEAHVNQDPASNSLAGIEFGCYTRTGVNTGTITPTLNTSTCPGAVDTDATAGLSGAAGTAIPFNTGPGFLILDNGALVGIRLLPN
jgi:hypothetical protein